MFKKLHGWPNAQSSKLLLKNLAEHVYVTDEVALCLRFPNIKSASQSARELIKIHIAGPCPPEFLITQFWSWIQQSVLKFPLSGNDAAARGRVYPLKTTALEFLI